MDHEENPQIDVSGDDLDVSDEMNDKISEDSYFNWVDVTPDFQQTCDELYLGELVHDNSFGLFEAMSAIEMMDPKMDAGMVCNKAKRKVLNLEQGIREGKIKINDLTPEELIQIFDEIFACLVTWLEGHSLAQSVFTCLYLHNPYIIEDRQLKAFSILMLKIVDIVRDTINRASVFEEEDFQGMTYGFKLGTDITDLRVLGMMKEVEDEVSRVVKVTRSRVGEERDSKTLKEHSLALALHSRLKFSRLFFSTLVAFSKEKAQGVGDAEKFTSQMLELLETIKASIVVEEAFETVHKKQDTVKLTQDDAEEKQDKATNEQSQPTPGDESETVSSESQKSVEAPASLESAHISESSRADDMGSKVMGFEPLINQRLLPPTFPRYTKIKGHMETYQYLEQMCQSFKHACQLLKVNGNLHCIIEFFQEFSRSNPCVLSRSVLQLVYLSRNRRAFGQTAMTDVVKDTIKSFISPPYYMPKSSLAVGVAKEYVETFITHTVRPMVTLIQVSGHNRARQRDKLAGLLEELATLQDEGDKLDAYLHQQCEPGRQHLACFGTWVLYHTLQVMIQYTLLGFELELYALHEYHYIYWYLYECLFPWYISTLSRADNFYLDQLDRLKQQQAAAGGKRKDRGKKKRAPPHAKQVQLAQAHQNLTGGYYKAVLGLELDGKLKQPKFDFDCEEVRYNHRFAAFGCMVTPPVVHYGQYRDMTSLRAPRTPADFYTSAAHCFQQARLHYESLTNPSQEVQVLIRIAKTNLVVMKLLTGGHKKDSPPEFDFSQHKVFPVIKLS